MLWPAMISYCLGTAAPARDPEPAQGTNAKQRATGLVCLGLRGLLIEEAFKVNCGGGGQYANYTIGAHEITCP